MPGITEELFLKACANACKPHNLFLNGQLVNLSDEQWEQLEDYCREELGLSEDWQEQQYAELVDEMRRDGWMTTYGPNPVINKRKLKEDRQTGPKKSPVTIEETTQESLF